MKHHIATAILACLTAHSIYGQTLTRTSPDLINPENGHTYFLLSTGNWQDSEASATAYGGHLVTITSAVEQSWVFTTFSAYNAIPRSLWIGLTDQDQEGTFEWASSEALDYSNWRVGEPNNANTGENYVHMHAPGTLWAGEWNDVDSAVQFPTHDGFTPHGVVEIIPEPSSYGLILFSIAALLLMSCKRLQNRDRTGSST